MKITLSTFRDFTLLGIPLLLPLVTYLQLDNRGFEISKVILFILLVLIVTTYTIVTRQYKRIPYLTLGLTAWISWNSISSVVNNSFAYSFWGDQWYMFGLFTMLFLVIYATLSSWVVSSYYLPFIVYGLVVSGVIQALSISFQSSYVLQSRTTSTLGEPNWLGSMLMISFVCCCFLLFSLKRSHTYWRYSLIAAGIIGIGILTTGSRSALLTSIITVLFIPLLLKHKLPALLKTLSLVFVLGSIFLACFYVGLNASSMEEKIQTLPITVRGLEGTDSRIWVYQKGLSLFVQKPLIGWGWDRIGFAYKQYIPDTRIGLEDLFIPRSHNIFLDLFISGGIGSFALFSVILVVSLHKGIKNISHNHHSAALVLVIFSLFIYGQLNTFSIAHWVMIFFLFGVFSFDRHSQKS